MIAAALLAAVLVAAPVVPARGNSDVPLVHVVGWNLLITAQSGADVWEYDGAEHDVAFTLAAGDSVEVRWGGSCTIDGVTHRSTMFRHAFCYGRGGG